MPRFKPPGQCPNCGEWVPRGAVACDECGSCARSGWNADAEQDGLDLPSDDFDYDDFIAREFGTGTEGGRTKDKQALFWKAVGIVLLVVMIAGLLLTAR